MPVAMVVMADIWLVSGLSSGSKLVIKLIRKYKYAKD
jgi:hypothetical protein